MTSRRDFISKVNVGGCDRRIGEKEREASRKEGAGE